jgi:lipid A 4'-phosphatase
MKVLALMLLDDQAVPYTQAPQPTPSDLYWPIYVCLAALAVSAGIFILFPSIDLAFSALFYTPGRGFLLGRTTLFHVIRTVGIWISIGTIAGLITTGVLWLVRPSLLPRWPVSRFGPEWLFLTLSMAIGAGLLVNLITKPVWGRARPVHIEQFGGHQQFTPAWKIANQCAWNCSFVSGEGAAAALVLAFCFVVPASWRLTTLLVASIIAVVVSFARIAVGGHFLSDVITAWILMALLIFVLRAQIYHGALLGPLKQWLPAKRSKP